MMVFDEQCTQWWVEHADSVKAIPIANINMQAVSLWLLLAFVHILGYTTILVRES